ncbi:MAG: xanthine phosphoribosyltransferase [Tissierellia bacterium]|nr:xanthine phosphoribosyltransferase [Tissierellia bacterium]
MDLLKQRIVENGRVLPGNILKVDSFINHMIDPQLFMEIGKEFATYFSGQPIDKVLTLEVSGIGVAVMTGYILQVPVLFAKKTVSKTLSVDCYETDVFSYTKNTTYKVRVDAKFLEAGERVLIVDDFLANGQAMFGLIDICNQAKCEVAGVGIVIEKGFQPGGKQLRENGYDVHSLAVIDRFDDGKVVFR